MKSAHETGDLCLLPYLDPRDKKALLSVGVCTVADLAALKRPADEDAGVADLIPVPEAKPVLDKLAATSAGSRIDEFIHRARSVLKSQGETVKSLYKIPGRGHSSLPHSAPDFHPN